MTRILERAGYGCITAGSGDEAVGILSEGEEVDLVLCDVGLPGMPVSRCLEEVAAARPGLPVVLMSGHGADEVASAVGSERPVEVRKPFGSAELLEVVEGALSAG